MAKKAALSTKTADSLVKAMLVFSRTADYVLEKRAVDAVSVHPLSSSKVQVLRLLGNRDGQTSTQIARFLGVSKPAVSQIIDSMVRQKLVTRKTATADRREINLRLTKKGNELFQTIRQQQRHCVRNALRTATGRGATSWVNTLEELSRALGDADQAYQHFCAQCGAHSDGTCVLVDGDAECVFLQQRPRSAKRTGTTASKR